MTKEKMKFYCDEMLLSLLGNTEDIDVWWHSPNRGFEGKRPKDCDLKDVMQYLMTHCFR